MDLIFGILENFELINILFFIRPIREWLERKPFFKNRNKVFNSVAAIVAIALIVLSILVIIGFMIIHVFN